MIAAPLFVVLSIVQAHVSLLARTIFGCGVFSGTLSKIHLDENALVDYIFISRQVNDVSSFDIVAVGHIRVEAIHYQVVISLFPSLLPIYTCRQYVSLYAVVEVVYV